MGSWPVGIPHGLRPTGRPPSPRCWPLSFLMKERQALTTVPLMVLHRSMTELTGGRLERSRRAIASTLKTCNAFRGEVGQPLRKGSDVGSGRG